jgi:hypothetical protein
MTIEASWLSDPSGRHELRYWDGEQWTDHVADDGTQGSAPFVPADATSVAEPTSAAVTTSAEANDGRLIGKGMTGWIEVNGQFVTITRKGALAKMNYGWTRGEKRIPIASIAAVQYKKPGMSRGYIQFTLPGGIEGKKGLLQSGNDENSVQFGSSSSAQFEAIRDHIESAIAARHAPAAPAAMPAPNAPDLTTQLRGLAELRDDGIITEEEFQAQKAKLLG